MIHNVDTGAATHLQDYGGDLKKRWYIDVYTSSTKKRVWIANKPDYTRSERSGLLLAKISNQKLVNNRYFKYKILKDIKNKEVRDITKRNYESQVCLFFEFCKDKLNICYLEELNKKAVDAYLVYLKSKNFSKKTISNKINALKSAFSDCEVNIFSGCKVSKGNDESDFHNPFSEFERQQIEKYLLENNKDLYLYTRFLFYAFIRPAELRQLKVKDVDFVNRTIKISASISKVKKSLSVPIVKPFYDIIKDSGILNNPKEFYLFGKDLKPSLNQLAKNKATNMHRECLIELGIYRKSYTTLYAWKHTGNIQAFLAKVDINIIRMMNRHRSVLTTEIYLRKLGLFLNHEIFDIVF